MSDTPGRSFLKCTIEDLDARTSRVFKNAGNHCSRYDVTRESLKSKNAKIKIQGDRFFKNIFLIKNPCF